jgi:hypothetical protein
VENVKTKSLWIVSLGGALFDNTPAMASLAFGYEYLHKPTRNDVVNSLTKTKSQEPYKTKEGIYSINSHIDNLTKRFKEDEIVASFIGDGTRCEILSREIEV